MILTLWVTLALLAASCVALGYALNTPHYALVGFFFLFLLGLTILTNNLEVQSGSITVFSYTCSPCGGNNSIILSQIETYQYTAFTGTFARWFGLFFSVASGFGIALTLMAWRKGYDDD